VGTKVPMTHERNDWSVKGLSGHESVGHHKFIFYSSSVGTLTCVKLLVTSVESVLPPCSNNSQ
jgi:hypothetical protein